MEKWKFCYKLLQSEETEPAGCKNEISIFLHFQSDILAIYELSLQII